jgi:hypothetical protein
VASLSRQIDSVIVYVRDIVSLGVRCRVSPKLEGHERRLHRHHDVAFARPMQRYCCDPSLCVDCVYSREQSNLGLYVVARLRSHQHHEPNSEVVIARTPTQQVWTRLQPSNTYILNPRCADMQRAMSETTKKGRIHVVKPHRPSIFG